MWRFPLRPLPGPEERHFKRFRTLTFFRILSFGFGPSVCVWSLIRLVDAAGRGRALECEIDVQDAEEILEEGRGVGGVTSVLVYDVDPLPRCVNRSDSSISRRHTGWSST